MQGPLTLSSTTSTEVQATVPSLANGSKVAVVVNGEVQSDAIGINVP
jgi:hypothetical protein